MKHLVLAAAVAAPAMGFMTSGSSGVMPLRSAQLSAASSVSRASAPKVCSLKMGELGDKYGHLRGQEVESCDKAVMRFHSEFGKPVPFVFRSPTNEILYLTHLDVVNARWKKELIWVAGLYSTFDLFFQALEENTRNELFAALMKALKLDPSEVKSEATKVLDWAKGKSEADVVKAINGEDDSEVGQAFASAKASDFLYTRNFGAGLIKVMQVVGVEPNSESSKRWADVLGFRAQESAITGMSMSRFETDVGLFLSSVEKMQEIMQLYAEVEAREKKKVAERLAEKAAKAAEEATTA